MTADSQAMVRRLWTADMAAFRDHLLRLDPRSRHDRFSGAVSDEFLVHYAENCFGAGDLVFGAFVDGQLRGAGELRSESAIWTESAPFSKRVLAEAAFSVEEPYRRCGLGGQLFSRIVRAASNHGVETIEIMCQADNRPMQKLAAKFSTELRFEAHEITGRLIARRPTPFFFAVARSVAGRRRSHRFDGRRANARAFPEPHAGGLNRATRARSIGALTGRVGVTFALSASWS